LVVWFSRTAICPVVWNPKAATARPFFRSPLKSAASTSATRGQPSSQKVPNFPFGRPAQPDHRAFLMIVGEELAEIRDEEILKSVAVDVHQRHVRGVRRVRENGQFAGRLQRITDQQEPLAHFGRDFALRDAPALQVSKRSSEWSS